MGASAKDGHTCIRRKVGSSRSRGSTSKARRSCKSWANRMDEPAVQIEWRPSVLSSTCDRNDGGGGHSLAIQTS